MPFPGTHDRGHIVSVSQVGRQSSSLSVCLSICQSVGCQLVTQTASQQVGLLVS